MPHVSTMVAVLLALTVLFQTPDLGSAVSGSHESRPMSGGAGLLELGTIDRQTSALAPKVWSDTRIEVLSFAAHLNATLLTTNGLCRDFANLRQSISPAASAEAHSLLMKVRENEDIGKQLVDGLDYLKSKSNALGAGAEDRLMQLVSSVTAETNVDNLGQSLLELSVEPTAAVEPPTPMLHAPNQLFLRGSDSLQQKVPPSSVAETNKVAAKAGILVDEELVKMEAEFATDLAAQARLQNDELKQEKDRLLVELSKERSRAVEFRRQLDSQAQENEQRYQEEVVALRQQRNLAYVAIASGGVLMACLAYSQIGATTRQK